MGQAMGRRVEDAVLEERETAAAAPAPATEEEVELCVESGSCARLAQRARAPIAPTRPAQLAPGRSEPSQLTGPSRLLQGGPTRARAGLAPQAADGRLLAAAKRRKWILCPPIVFPGSDRRAHLLPGMRGGGGARKLSPAS